MMKRDVSFMKAALEFNRGIKEAQFRKKENVNVD